MPGWTKPDPAADLASARKTVGDTPESRARWLLGLLTIATDYFPDLPSPEQYALRAEMGVFLGRRTYVRDEDAKRWLKRIREGLRKLAAGKAWRLRLVTSYGFWIPLPGQRGGTKRLVKGKWGTRVVRFGDNPGHIEPTAPDLLHFTPTRGDDMDRQVCETLAAVGDRVRRCPLHDVRRGCRGLFLRVKRQRFCTDECASAERSRRYRARRGDPCQPVSTA